MGRVALQRYRERKKNKLVYYHLEAFGDLGVFPINAEGWDVTVPTCILTTGEDAFYRERKLPRYHRHGSTPGCIRTYG